MTPQDQYEQLQTNLAQGWNTWDTRSVLSHVHLPSGLAFRLGIKEYRDGGHLREALIGRTGADDEVIVPGPRAWDGAYTSIEITWRGVTLRIETATQNGEWHCLVTPLTRERQLKTPLLIVEGGFLWNRGGAVVREGATLRTSEKFLQSSVAPVEEPQTSALGAYLALSLETPLALWTGEVGGCETDDARLPEHEVNSLQEVQQLMGARRAQLQGDGSDEAEIRGAIRTCLAWDTIYDPSKSRVISPVSRIWSSRQGGWVLFCWDTFFAAQLCATGSRELAYANALEILREMTPQGFVPNVSNAHGFASLDRSQPPVGSLVFHALYQQFKDRWPLELAFDDLLRWNRWWSENRVVDGLLTWGSNPYEPQTGHIWEYPEQGVGERFGASLESGLDNSPMYDGVPFNPYNHCLELQDAGLSALYVADCEALSEIAVLLERPEATELRARGAAMRAQMSRLWDEEQGIFANRRTDTREFSARLSPTNFYPLLAGAATAQQARRMMDDHLLNPSKFWGNWVLPSIARDDVAYPEQHYWRGRIWAPMNYLVYLGLKRAKLDEEAASLAQKSAALFLQEWRAHGHVHENYHAETGWGCGYEHSDRFYHWGALLGLMSLIEMESS